MTDSGKVPWIVRIATPVWLLGLIIVALLVDLALDLPAVGAPRALLWLSRASRCPCGRL
jgi:hypothetical protein